LSAAIQAYAECCQGRTDFTDFTATKVGLLILSRMIFIQYDTDVLYHSCLALHHTLEGLERGQINEVIGMGFVEHILKVLPTAPLNIQISALKSINLISMAGDTCIKAILDVNGVSYLSKALSGSEIVQQDRQDLACRSMYNIILYDRDQIQTAIDNNAVPELVQILQRDTNKKCNALVTIQEIAKAGTTEQVRCLVSNDCIQHLCEVLDSEWNSATIALQALKDILRHGKKEDAQNKTMTSNVAPTSTASNIQIIEQKLGELTNEIEQIMQEVKRVKVLEHEKAWLEYHIQKKHVKPLGTATNFLEEERQKTFIRLKKYKAEAAKAGLDTTLGQMYDKLCSKENETKSCLVTQIHNIGNDFTNEQTKLQHLLKEAEKKGPRTKDWSERPANELSGELKLVKDALKGAEAKLESLKSTQTDNCKQADHGQIETGLRRLFFNDDDWLSRETTSPRV